MTLRGVTVIHHSSFIVHHFGNSAYALADPQLHTSEHGCLLGGIVGYATLGAAVGTG
jgi:hypothetical protein